MSDTFHIPERFGLLRLTTENREAKLIAPKMGQLSVSVEGVFCDLLESPQGCPQPPRERVPRLFEHFLFLDNRKITIYNETVRYFLIGGPRNRDHSPLG
jgi:hypothetical protein